MTTLHDRITSDPSLNSFVEARDLDAITVALNTNPTKSIQSRYITMRTIVSECSDADAIISALLAATQYSPALSEMLSFLRSDSGMDIGHPNAQARLDAMATAGLVTTDQATELKNLALLPDVVTRLDVANALYNPDGSLK